MEFKEILSNLQLLSRQVAFTLQNYVLLDEKMFAFLKNLEANIFHMERLQLNYDDTKILCRFLWQMFTGFNIVEGDVGCDPIEKAIKQI